MTESGILKIYEEFKVPQNIISHMRMVAHVAQKIAEELIRNGHKIDLENLINAALVHDALRVVDIKEDSLKKLAGNDGELSLWLGYKEKYKSIGHERAMSRILKEKNENYLANLVEKHGFFEISKLKTLEEKILYYSDKRVNHDKIVTLEKRFEEGKKRNMSPDDNMELVEKTETEVFALEKEFIELLKVQSLDELWKITTH